MRHAQATPTRLRLRQWLLVFTCLLPRAGHAQRVAGVVDHRDIEVRPALDADSERSATFLAGGEWQKVRSPSPGQAAEAAAPAAHGWLRYWQQTLLDGLQPARLTLSPGHALLMLQPTVLLLATTTQPMDTAAALPWTRLACPTSEGATVLPTTGPAAPRVGLALQVLRVTDDGIHDLGLDIWCRQPQRNRLLRFTRLLVRTDGQGHPLAATGVVLDQARAMPDAAPDAVVEPPFAPAFHGPKQPQWLLATPAGWVVQLQIAPRAIATRADGLPRIEVMEANQIEESAPQRAILWLDLHAVPRKVLWAGARRGQIPLPLHGVWNQAVADDATLLLQAVAVPGAADGGTVWREAGLLAWRVQGVAAIALVGAELPRLAREGFWSCHGALQGHALRCQFQGPQLPGQTQPTDVELEDVGKAELAVRVPENP